MNQPAFRDQRLWWGYFRYWFAVWGPRTQLTLVWNPYEPRPLRLFLQRLEADHRKPKEIRIILWRLNITLGMTS